MTVASRKTRGYATQRMVAEWFNLLGWPYATAVGAGESGVDIRHMAGLAPEVKAQPGDVTGALKQAVRNARNGDLPFVVWRPNGYGPAVIQHWPVVLRLEDFTRLLHQAGLAPAAAGVVENEV